MIQSQEIELARAQAPPDPVQVLPPPTEALRSGAALTSLLPLLQNLTDEARAIIGAHHGLTRVSLDDCWSQVVSALSLSDKYAAWKTADTPTDGFGIDSLVCPVIRSTRLSHEDMLAHPAWGRFSKTARNRPPMRGGWLAVPLINRHGRNFGMIELTDKEGDDFDASDELKLVRFARIVALAVENARLYQSAGKTKADAASLLPNLSVETSGAASANGVAAVALHAAIAKTLAQDDDLRAAMQGCADAVAHYTGAALTRIWTGGVGVMNLQASTGSAAPPDDARAHVPVGQFTIGHVVRTRQPLRVDAIADHPHIHDKEWSRREGMTSFAGFPLLADNDLQGVLAIFDRKPIAPAAFDAILNASADLALAIQRSRADDPDATPEAGPCGEHAVIVTRLDGAITDWNHGAEKLFGYRRAEAVGQPLALLVPPERADEHRAILQRVARGEQVARPQTVRRQRSGRSLEVRLTAAPLRDDSGLVAGAVTVIHDLAEVKQLQQQLCLAQKMEICGQLAGGVAHDFNNILTVILGYSEIILSRLGGADPLRELLGEVQKAGQRGESLTRQLLAFSRKKVVDPKILDLNAVVADTEKMLRRLIGEDILMTTIFAPKLKPVKIDAGHMQQIFLNLAINARDAMAKGGRLTIETDNVALDEAYALTHPHVQPGDYVLFAISDTGVGMNLATQSRIFEPLFTTKGPGKGTGLGLTTVQSIVNQYGGHIEVYSEVGRGTTFKVYLPQADEVLSLARANTHLRTIPRGHETVLVVEDNDSVRNFAKHVLDLSGYKVLEAADGEHALRVAHAHAGPIHLLVTDVVMPHLAGPPLADRVLQFRPHLKVLFVSGYTNEAVVRHGVLESDYPFLQKPFTTAAFAQKVREVLDQPARAG